MSDPLGAGYHNVSIGWLQFFRVMTFADRLISHSLNMN